MGSGLVDRILKVKDIQENLGISKSRAYELINMRGFPKIQIGRRYYIPESEYKEWISDHLKRKVLL